MAKRGPKPRATPPGPAGPFLWADFAPPADLDAEAAAEFRRLAAALDAVGTRDRTDPRLVVAAARTHSLLERAHADLAKDGLTLTATNGTAMPHPMLAVANQLTMRLRGLLADMGLTPATARLGAAPAAEANPWDGLLNVAG